MFSSEKSSFNNFVNRLLWGSDPDTPNPVSGLTRRDIQRIQKTWSNQIYGNAAVYGLEIFLRVFQKDPDTRGYFRFIKDLTDEQIGNSNRFKAHVQSVMGSFHTVINNINEPEVAIALLHKLGDAHHIKHVEKKHFEELKVVFTELLTQDLKLNDQTVNSWAKFIDFMNKHIFERLNLTVT